MRTTIAIVLGLIALAASATATVIGWMLLSGVDELFRMPTIVFAAIYAGAAALTWWSFVAYAVFHYFRTRSS
jgi:ethanolamine transporter EutH